MFMADAYVEPSTDGFRPAHLCGLPVLAIGSAGVAAA